MKRASLLMLNILIGILSIACTNEQKLEEEQKELEAKQAQLIEETLNTAIPSAEFNAFARNFTHDLQTTVFNAEWLHRFSNQAEIREISPKICEGFIYGKKVWNHNLISNNSEHTELSNEKTYYYVGTLRKSNEYTALIFNDLEERATETYLCTYTKSGKFISGIVLQAQHKIAPEQLVSRDTEVYINNQITQLMIVEQRADERHSSIFKILPSGEIVPDQRNS